MGMIKVLDCTLRDGGYCNSWEFGQENARAIVKGLLDAHTDIIECGFLTENVEHQAGMTRFAHIEETDEILPEQDCTAQFAIMINYGEYDISQLPYLGQEWSQKNKYCTRQHTDVIQGSKKHTEIIRLAFHKKDSQEALEQGRMILEKGYRLFLQPMVTLSYSDDEFLRLIAEANDIRPEAFYIVDSFGMMKKKELLRLFYLTEHNLSDGIAIGFHSHNNMQLAFSNAQVLADFHASRDLIIDSSIYGMGRGAGNLNTELFMDYLDDCFGGNYCIRPLIAVIDDVLDAFYKKNSWGYSLPNYLSAAYQLHPDYAGWLSDKNTLNVEDMDAVLGMMDEKKKVYFDKEYIEHLYIRYLSSGKVHEQHRKEVQNALIGKKVLLIAPGKSSFDEREGIREFAKKENTVVISVNHDYAFVHTDFIFLSNLRRFRELPEEKKSKCITTSNIPDGGVYLKTDYRELLNRNESVMDNAGLLAIKFLLLYGVGEIWMAGFDGYSHDCEDNYAQQGMLFVTKNELADKMNMGMCEVLRDYGKQVQIYFLTKPKYLDI